MKVFDCSTVGARSVSQGLSELSYSHTAGVTYKYE